MLMLLVLSAATEGKAQLMLMMRGFPAASKTRLVRVVASGIYAAR